VIIGIANSAIKTTTPKLDQMNVSITAVKNDMNRADTGIMTPISFRIHRNTEHDSFILIFVVMQKR
jgi:hypothetical protein